MDTRPTSRAIPFAATVAAALLATGCASSAPGAPGDSALVGTWRLVSFEIEAQGTGERSYPMGKAPAGYVSFTADGRMAALVTAEGRQAATSEPERARLYSTMLAYTGTYQADGGKWITKVDASANPAWVGTEQPRSYKISGKQMFEVTPWLARPDKTMFRANNVWERVQ